MFDLKTFDEKDVADLTKLANLSDLFDGDIDDPATADAIRALALVAVTTLRKALAAKSAILDKLAGPILEKIVKDYVEKWIKDHTAKPA